MSTWTLWYGKSERNRTLSSLNSKKFEENVVFLLLQ